MTLTITAERLAEIKELLREWEDKTTHGLMDLQQLLGKLNFTCNTVRSGRVLMSRSINDLKCFPWLGRWKVTTELCRDIQWYITFIESYDGVTKMPPEKWDRSDLIFSSDTCLTGCGSWHYLGERRPMAFHAKFPTLITRMAEAHINDLELLALIVSIKKWDKGVKDCNILAYCDNQVTVEVINKEAAKNRFTQACMREICYLMGVWNAML